MKIGEIIKDYRKKHDLTLRDFAQKAGMSHGYIAMLEDGKNSKTKEPMIPTLPSLKKISTALGISLSELISVSDDMPVKLQEEDLIPIRTIIQKKLPMLGNVACGEPIFANEDHETLVDADGSLDADFCLTAKGNSMINARIFDGDILFVKSQASVNDGEIAVVLIEDEATVKRVYYDKENNIITLMPENPMYKPMRFEGEKLNQIRILGRVVFGHYSVN